jgi:hypothetical protein
MVQEAAKKQIAWPSDPIRGRSLGVNAKDTNLDFSLSNISQPVRFIFRNEGHGTFANGDVDRRGFGFVRELPHPIPMMISSSPGTHLVKSAPGASLTRVSMSCERSAGTLSLLVLTAEAQLERTVDDDTPQPQPPFGKI